MNFFVSFFIGFFLLVFNVHDENGVCNEIFFNSYNSFSVSKDTKMHSIIQYKLYHYINMHIALNARFQITCQGISEKQKLFGQRKKRQNFVITSSKSLRLTMLAMKSLVFLQISS